MAADLFPPPPIASAPLSGELERCRNEEKGNWYWFQERLR